VIRWVIKALAWVVGSVVALVAVVHLVALIVNWQDAPPSEAARRMADSYDALPAVADEDNARVYVMGLQAARAGDNAVPPSVAAVVDACDDPTGDCVAALASASAAEDAWTAADPLALPRYREILTRTAWRDDVSTGPPSAQPFLLLREGQRRLLLNAYSLAERGDAEQVRSLLVADMRFWRMVLESADRVLPTKALAATALWRHFRWGNIVLRHLGPAGAAAMPAGWRAPFTDSERSMARCAVAEWVVASSYVRDMHDRVIPGEVEAERFEIYLLAPLFKPQDTINRLAEQYSALSRELEAPLAEYPAALERAAALEKHAVNDARSLYNPIGRVIFAGVADLDRYAARVADLEGVRRAALAAVTLRASAIGVDAVEAALAASDLRNPYDGSPLLWNATERLIVFRGIVYVQGVRVSDVEEHHFAY
jgi:hypothetical protein